MDIRSPFTDWSMNVFHPTDVEVLCYFLVFYPVRWEAGCRQPRSLQIQPIYNNTTHTSPPPSTSIGFANVEDGTIPSPEKLLSAESILHASNERLGTTFLGCSADPVC